MRKSFKMKLYEGQEKEYEKRHNELWPEMKEMIHEYGGKNYSIFLDKETNILYGYIEIENAELWDESANTEICKKWWAYMADIMETNSDNSPVSINLEEVFHLDWEKSDYVIEVSIENKEEPSAFKESSSINLILEFILWF